VTCDERQQRLVLGRAAGGSSAASEHAVARAAPGSARTTRWTAARWTAARETSITGCDELDELASVAILQALFATAPELQRQSKAIGVLDVACLEGQPVG
jgi:hypothetical protein